MPTFQFPPSIPSRVIKLLNNFYVKTRPFMRRTRLFFRLKINVYFVGEQDASIEKVFA